MVKTEDFERWVCAKHRVDRVVVECSEGYLRPNMWMVVRRVPRHYRIVPPPKPVEKPVLTQEPAYDIEDEFGPDPMSQRPEAPWRKRRCAPFIPNDAFVRDTVADLYRQCLM
jgi:hypothetical protein